MAAADPAERALRARIAAASRWANCDDRSAATAAARKAAADRFEKQVDPEGRLDPEERAKRASAARSAYFSRLALASKLARRSRRSG